MTSNAHAAVLPMNHWQAELDLILASILDTPERALTAGQEFHQKYDAVVPEEVRLELDIRLAYARVLLGDWVNAYKKLEEIKLKLSPEQKALRAILLHTIGNLHNFNGDTAGALSAYFDALALRETIPDKSELASTLNNIAGLLARSEQYSESLRYFERVRKLGEEIASNHRKGDAEIGAFAVYVELGDYESANEKIARAQEAYRDEHPHSWRAIATLAATSEIAILQRRSQDADGVFEQAMERVEKAGLLPLQIELYRRQAKAYLSVSQFAKALTASSKGLALAQQRKNDDDRLALLLARARALAGLKRFQEAAVEFENWHTQSASYNRMQSVMHAQMMQIRYQSLKKEEEIVELTKQNELQRLRLQQETWQKNAWIAGLLLLFIAAVASFLVISHRNELKRQQAVNKRLLELDRLKDQVLANTSHELRTPLNGIVGLSEIMLAEKMNPDHHHMVELIARSGRRLSLMVNDLLDFAKLKHSDTPLEKSVVNLRESVSQALSICQTGVGEKSLRLLNEIQDEKLLVSANADRLQQILCNLINNAIKFSEVGVIRVSALLDAEQRVRIVVSDNGVGISPADQQRIFEPFEQVDGSLSRRHEGAGLGLAICRRLVELHGGQIGVQSTPGLGSQFWFTLPRA